MSVLRLTFLYPRFLWTARSYTSCKQARNLGGRIRRAKVSTLGSRLPRLPASIIQRRCASGLQQTYQRDNGSKTSSLKNKPPAQALNEGPGKDNKNSSSDYKSESDVPTDIGSHYTPPRVQERIDSTTAIREASKDTSALDVLTKLQTSIDKKGEVFLGGNNSKEAGSGGSEENGESLGKEPVLSPTIAKLYHNFDTFAMVKQLEAAQLTYGQSVTAMKAIRGLLATNLEKAKDSMVSKSMSENESYLFRAACSELQTEIESARRTALERTRIDRAQIQHDYDQLEHKLSEDLLNLKDEVSSLFNDRKMVTRQEQRAMEVKIQELNYKLTILLNGDMKSDIEALRWTTTRRGLIAIAIIAVLVVTLIRYTSVQSHAIKKESAQDGKDDKVKETLNHAANSGLIASISTPSGSKPDNRDQGDGGSFVSLG